MSILNVKAELTEALREAVEGCEQLTTTSLPVFEITLSREPAHGDCTTNLPFLLAQKTGMEPQEVGRLLLQCLSPIPQVVEKAEVGGGGFLNFTLSPSFLVEELRQIVREADLYGRGQEGKERVLVEFVSANPTGPLVVANARAAAVGDSLVRILNFSGCRAESEYYVDDSGRQVQLLGESLEARYRELQGEEVPFPEEGYKGEYVKELARELVSQGVPTEDPSRLKETFREYALRRIIENQRSSLESFGVDFDHWCYESTYRDSGKGSEVIEELRSRDYTYEKEGALWFKTTEFGDEEDRVLVKSDGELTYVVPDIAYHLDKFQRGYERLIDVLGPDHHGHVPKLRAALSALGYASDKLEALIVQWVTFHRGGKKVGMSKRGGEFVTMDELMEEVGVDAARFFFLMRKTSAHLDFDLDLAKKKSEENPVYYVQYAHARISSILRFAEEGGVRLPSLDDTDLSLLKKDEENLLIRKLVGFPELVQACSSTLEPHRITFYLLELATLFHNFYQKRRVVTDDLPLTYARLLLVQGVRQVIRNCLSLIGVSAPDSM